MSDLTLILAAMQKGEPKAASELLALVYEELRSLAARRMARESSDHTLQPTALVHEAWLRLNGREDAAFEDRTHFFAAAAEAMRQILVDHARRKKALKRGGGAVKVSLQEIDIAKNADDENLLLVDEALRKLAGENARAAELIKLRFFAGLNNHQAAQALGISERSAKRDWTFARAWLYRELSSAGRK